MLMHGLQNVLHRMESLVFSDALQKYGAVL